MTAERTVPLSFSVSSRRARLLVHRSKTNLVETLVLQLCEATGIAVEDLAGTPRTSHLTQGSDVEEVHRVCPCAFRVLRPLVRTEQNCPIHGSRA